MKFEKKAGKAGSFILAFALFVFCQFLLLVNGSAYLDPSTMTYVIQIVAGAVIASGTAVAVFWHKIKRFFKRLFKSVVKEDALGAISALKTAPAVVESDEAETRTAAERKTCPFCKVELAVPTAKFCGECGAALRRKCPSCGVEITAPKAKFCADCGAALNE
ncbi:MAG: zinc ribbon domain-containing protein [Treponema sp.]|nr:zinc ribbon domain-containing protein [Treponema sp.]